VNGTIITVTGGSLSSIAPTMTYVVALIAHYPFLPPLSEQELADQVVDAVAFSQRNKELNVEIIQAFLPILKDEGKEDLGLFF